MVHIGDRVKKQRERELAEKKNPHLKLNLGELIQEMNRLCVLDPNIIRPEKDIPKKSLKNYKKYISLANELKRREEEYNSYKSPPTF